MTRLLPPTKAVTSKFSGARPGPTTACERPVPAFDLAGKSISIFSAVVPSTLFLMNVVTLAAFGFFFVPALLGVSLVVAVMSPSDSPVCATATEASAMEARAASAAIRYLRKESPPQEMECRGQGGTGAQD